MMGQQTAGMGAGMARGASQPATPRPGNDNAYPANDDQGPANDNEQPNVSPEEQAAYEEFVKNGMEIIYPRGEQASVAPAVMANLQGQYDEGTQQVFAKAQPPITPSPTDALAVAATSVVLALEASAAQSQHPIDPDVVQHGGSELMEQLADVSQAANIHDYSEKEMEDSLYRAVDLYRVSSANVDPDQAAQGFEQIVQADKSGNLDQVLPGIGSRMQQGQQQPQPQGQQAQPQQAR